MKKIFYAFMLVFALTGCGKYENETVSLSELGSALSFAADMEDVVYEDLMDMEAAAHYGISPNEIEGGVVYRSTDGEEADEVILVKAKNHDFLRNVEMALESEANDLSNAWKYDAEEREKTEKHILKTRGMYVLLAVTEEPERVEKVFDGMIR